MIYLKYYPIIRDEYSLFRKFYMIQRGFQLIETTSDLQEFVEKLKPVDQIALDTESDSMYHYHYKICLIQVSEGTFDWLIDPLAITDLSPLFESFSHSQLILHGADYDLRMLRENYSFQPDHIFDTMIAAQYLGFPKIGLGNLVQHFFGITLNKADQKANWSLRPLSESMKTYAALDTRFLHEMREKLTEELLAKERLHWVEQACERLVQQTFIPPKIPDPEKKWRINGSGPLNTRQLGILRSIWQWREQTASAVDRPPFQVMNNQKLVALSEIFSRMSRPDFTKIGRCSKLIQTNHKDALKEALLNGMQLKESDLPSKKAPRPPKIPTPNTKYLEKIKNLRDSTAQKLGIEATLIANRHRMVLLALNKESDPKKIMEKTGLLPWQFELLKPAL